MYLFYDSGYLEYSFDTKVSGNPHYVNLWSQIIPCSTPHCTCISMLHSSISTLYVLITSGWALKKHLSASRGPGTSVGCFNIDSSYCKEICSKHLCRERLQVKDHIGSVYFKSRRVSVSIIHSSWPSIQIALVYFFGTRGVTCSPRPAWIGHWSHLINTNECVINSGKPTEVEVILINSYII